MQIMLKCGCFEGLRKGSQRPRALAVPGPSDSSASSPSMGSTARVSPLGSPARLPEASLNSPADKLRCLSGDSNLLRDFAQPTAATEVVNGVQWANGFRTRPSVDLIRVDERNIHPFALPLEALTYEPPAEQAFAIFPNGDSERMVHCSTALGEQELVQLSELRALADRDGLAFSPSISVAATRFIGDARGDLPLALEKMCKSQAWRENFLASIGGPITDADMAEDLAHGVIYFGGRDFAMRPTLFVRPSRAPKHYRTDQGAKRLTKVLIFCLEYFLRYLALPGRIENVCVVVDLKDAGYMSIGCLLELAQVLSQQHAARVWRFYICNMNWLMNIVSNLAQAAMTDRQIAKIKFLPDHSVLQQDFALHQLEKDFGGTREKITSFFPFPMQPGPFEGGCRTGADANAVQGVHKVFTAEGACGRLWLPALSLEENTRLEFSDDAAAFFKQCGQPIAPTLLEAVNRKRTKAPQEPKKMASVSASLFLAAQRDELAASRDDSVKDDSTHAGDTSSRMDEDSNMMHSLDMTTEEVCPSSGFSCMLFRCHVGVSKRVKKV